MINSIIRIEYFDQNEEFSRFLPRTGKIIQQLIDEHGHSNWFLVKLDSPFEYQLKAGDNFQFRLINCDKLLIRSRWKDQEINLQKKTSVFIMLIPDEKNLLTVPIKINEYIHIAWGKAMIEKKQEPSPRN